MSSNWATSYIKKQRASIQCLEVLESCQLITEFAAKDENGKGKLADEKRKIFLFFPILQRKLGNEGTILSCCEVVSDFLIFSD
jgi:hypothetical protein